MQYKILLVVLFFIIIFLRIIYIQRKMINLMADEIWQLTDKIKEKSNVYDVIPIWFEKKHILKYFRKKARHIHRRKNK